MRSDGMPTNRPSCLVVDLSKMESQVAALDKKVATLQGQLVDLASVMSTLLAQQKAAEKKPAEKKAAPPKVSAPPPAPKPVAKPVAKKKAGSKRKR